jgi:hypothetical protein
VWSLGLFLVLLFLAYCFFERLNWSIIIKQKIFKKMAEVVRENSFFRTKVMTYSILRHVVFSVQFWLILYAFGQPVNFDTLLWIWQIFLWTTLIPSLWFGKLVIRESVAIWVLGALGYNEIAVLASSVLLWLINLAFPALLGLIICTKKNTTHV